jgi:hypothetical protein
MPACLKRFIHWDKQTSVNFLNHSAEADGVSICSTRNFFHRVKVIVAPDDLFIPSIFTERFAVDREARDLLLAA